MPGGPRSPRHGCAVAVPDGGELAPGAVGPLAASVSQEETAVSAKVSPPRGPRCACCRAAAGTLQGLEKGFVGPTRKH